MSSKIYHYINAGLIVQTRPFPLSPLRGAELNEIPHLRDAFVSIKDGKIIEVGFMVNWKAPENTQEIIVDLEGCWILPGFIDSHTHTVFPYYRSDEFEKRLKGVSYQQIAQEGGGIINTANRLQEYSEETLFDLAKARIDKMISKGTLALEIKSGYGLSDEGELKMLRTIQRLKEHYPIPIKSTFLAAHALPVAYKGKQDDYVNHVSGPLLKHVASNKLADYVDIFCETGYFTAEQTTLLIDRAHKLGIPSKIHTNQFTSIGGIQSAILSKAKSVDHLEVMTEKDIADLGKSNVMGCLLPIAPFFLNDPYPEGRAMVDNNVALALATDFNPGSAPNYDMSFAMSLACIKCGLLPNEAFNMATINAAFAMDLEGKAGAISVGALGNLIVTEPLERLADLPYRICSEYIRKVIINGEVWNG